MVSTLPGNVLGIPTFPKALPGDGFTRISRKSGKILGPSLDPGGLPIVLLWANGPCVCELGPAGPLLPKSCWAGVRPNRGRALAKSRPQRPSRTSFAFGARSAACISVLAGPPVWVVSSCIGQTEGPPRRFCLDRIPGLRPGFEQVWARNWGWLDPRRKARVEILPNPESRGGSGRSHLHRMALLAPGALWLPLGLWGSP